MSVEGVYENSDPVCSSYGYVPISYNSGPVSDHDIFSQFDHDARASPKTNIADNNMVLNSFPSGSFLRREFTPSTHDNPAVLMMRRAGCSEEAIEIVKLSCSGIHELDNVISKIPPADASRLSTQLDRESFSHWSTQSLFSGLGVDKNGVVNDLSLIKLCALLTNIESQVLIMQREITRYRNKVRNSKINGSSKELGFEDPCNLTVLSRILSSIDISTDGLSRCISSLKASLNGTDDTSPNNARLGSAIVICGCVVAVTMIIQCFSL